MVTIFPKYMPGRRRAKKAPAPELIVLHESIYMLVTRVVLLELTFLTLNILLTLPEVYTSISLTVKVELIPFYITFYALLGTIKIVILVYIILRWATKRYEIDKEEVRLIWGIIHLNVETYSCSHLEKVDYYQNILGRICNFGSLEIYSPAIKNLIILQNIPEPKKHLELLESRITESKSVAYKP